MVLATSPAPTFHDNDTLLARREDLLARLDGLAVLDDPADHGGVTAAVTRIQAEIDQVNATLVEVNQGLAVRGLSPFLRWARAENVEDLQSAARLGLWTAVCSYKPDRGSFPSWAHLVIRRTVHEAVRSLEHPTLSRADFASRPRIRRAARAIRPDDPAAITARDRVAARAGCSRGQVDMVLDPPRMESLSRPVGDDDGRLTLADVVAATARDGAVEDPAQAAITRLMAGEALQAVRAHLSGRERLVVIRRFGLDGEPPEGRLEIGSTLGISREMVRRLENRALRRLRSRVVLGTV